MTSALRQDELPAQMRKALEDVRASSAADLFVEAEGSQATLFFVAGRLAWVVATGLDQGLLEILERRTGMSRGALAARFRPDGIDALVAAGVLSSEELRKALLEHNARHLQHLLASGAIRDIRLIPAARPFRSGITFSIEEVLRWAPPPSSGTYPRGTGSSSEVAVMPRVRERRQTANMLSIVAPNAERQVGQVVDLARLRGLDGFVSAAVVDDVRALAAITDDPAADLQVATREWLLGSEARLATVAQDELEEVVITTARYHLLARPLDRAPALSVCLLIDRERGNLGAARLVLRAAAAER